MYVRESTTPNKCSQVKTITGELNTPMLPLRLYMLLSIPGLKKTEKKAKTETHISSEFCTFLSFPCLWHPGSQHPRYHLGCRRTLPRRSLSVPGPPAASARGAARARGAGSVWETGRNEQRNQQRRWLIHVCLFSPKGVIVIVVFVCCFHL